MVSTAENQQHTKNAEAMENAASNSATHTQVVTGKGNGEADHASAILPAMEQFVWLVRKIKNPALLVRLLRCEGVSLPESTATKTNKAKGVLAPPVREQVYQSVAMTPDLTRQRLERVAERIELLDNDYGRQAVLSFYDEHSPKDADVLARQGDVHGRALHLYLDQEYPDKESPNSTRFLQAEHTQLICRHWKSENYSSHYCGPLGATPLLDDAAKESLKRRILELFPKAPPNEIVIEQFKRYGKTSPSALEQNGKEAKDVLDTLTVTFNGAETHYPCVEHGEVVNHDVPSALSIKFSRDPTTGALSVFSDDREARRDLAAIYRDVVLAGDGAIKDMPILEFDLSVFGTPEVIKKLNNDCIPGISSIKIQHLRIASMEDRRFLDEANHKEIIQSLAHPLTIGMDRRETRDIYTIARERFHLNDLTGYAIQQIKLQIRIGNQPFRKAHNVITQLTLPNGFNDQSKTEDDRKLVLAQLERLGLIRRF
ncbi:MAG: hypothetical protein D4S02_16620 [Rhodocyclaceae bacterium]|nr:MAG: hypothetical protein D4S02_16620 [Rhodocyclaceae bacterium]